MMLAAAATEVERAVAELGSSRRERVDAARLHLCMLGGRAIGALTEVLEGPAHARVKVRVIPLLALIQDPRGRPPLIAMLLDRRPRLREVAARALGRFPRPDALAGLTRLLEREPRAAVREAAVQALVEQYRAGHEEALGPVLDLLAGRARASRARRAAVAVVPLLAVAQRRTLARRLSEDLDPVVRARAAQLADWPRPPGATTGHPRSRAGSRISIRRSTRAGRRPSTGSPRRGRRRSRR
jgi:HEAT repeat protein